MRRRTQSSLAIAACAFALAASLSPAANASSGHGNGHGNGHGKHGGKHGHHDTAQDYKRIGYFTQWGVYGRDFQVKDLDTSGTAAKLSHINYSFGNVSAEGKCFTGNIPGEADAWADYVRPLDAANSVDGVADTDDQALAGNFNQLRELKAKHPGLKVMISLGGWGWSTHFSDAVRTPASRKALVSSCIDLYIKGNLPVDGTRGGDGAAAGLFDGIDIDWEWPGSAGDTDTVYRPEDKRNFTALVHEFRVQLDAYAKSEAKAKDRKGKHHKGKHHKAKPKHYDLSAFVPTSPEKIDAGFDIPRIMRDFDFVNLQGYDFHVSGQATTAQQSALYAGKGDFSVDQTVRDWLKRGAPARKLVVGMPFYGQGWTGVTGGGDGLNQPATGPAQGTWGAGSEDYKALKKLADSGAYKVHRNVRDGSAWLFDGTTLWTYDDPQVLRAKTKYIRDHRLGGAMFWSLDGDTEDGELMTAVDRGLSSRR
ncbi:glycoside hydrolase family 18 protein [Streptomyces sp. NBC_00525]|uniref:glycoside hydrolase family 18 protein n=1 Tax=Streptomyces sp. NBC_00525 TaxID=2903660 RepID=UPI002E818907|nr:glycoside hydrolase family 18 protein [Streptomyces sp. NBC_00525]WUC95774.1 glycoside hydrolase family 18 protein [Streptomyces sp. NBC_00525]